MDYKFHNNLQSINYSPKDRTKIIRDIKELQDILILFQSSIPEPHHKINHENYFIKSLMSKYILHAYSILRLLSGTNIKSKIVGKMDTVYDIGSINVLTRAILETYLTFFYLFIHPQNDDEHFFRLDIYKLAGLKSRQRFRPSDDALMKRYNESEIEIEKLVQKIITRKRFNELSHRLRANIENGKQSKIYSWEQLFQIADLNTEFFQMTWVFFSDYSHSEYISLTQIRGLLKDVELSKKKNDTIINILLILTSIYIIDLRIKFNELASSYKNLTEDQKQVIEGYDEIGRAHS